MDAMVADRENDEDPSRRVCWGGYTTAQTTGAAGRGCQEIEARSRLRSPFLEEGDDQSHHLEKRVERVQHITLTPNQYHLAAIAYNTEYAERNLHATYTG